MCKLQQQYYFLNPTARNSNRPTRVMIRQGFFHETFQRIDSEQDAFFLFLKSFSLFYQLFAFFQRRFCFVFALASRNLK